MVFSGPTSFVYLAVGTKGGLHALFWSGGGGGGGGGGGHLKNLHTHSISWHNHLISSGRKRAVRAREMFVHAECPLISSLIAPGLHMKLSEHSYHHSMHELEVTFKF